MQLPDINQLDELIQLLRKRGVLSYKADGIELTLSAEAPAPRKRRSASSTSTADPISEDELSPEDMLFWSAGGSLKPDEGTQ